MPRSESSRSSSSGRSSRTSKSRGTTVSTKTVDVPLPKKSRAMDFILWTAGARPSQMLHLRRDDITQEDDYDIEWRKSGRERDTSFMSRRTRTQWHFVASPEYYDYDNYDDDQSTFSRSSKSKSRTRSSSSSSSASSRSTRRGHKTPRPKDPVWEKRRAHVESESESDDEESYYESDGDYGMPPPPPQMFHHPPPPQHGPPPPQGGDMPEFFVL